ncbi:hypothetical protein [Nonomuraea typhae]|uniref:hypothetical protein n=1 Tax=Nonomuraea typhae TaxID=2603600 RepID=UPI0012F836A2|nr:hypothetical protein [Nonomuraea typhae]
MTAQSERSNLASIAANERWARERDRTAATAAMRAKSPASIEYWLKKVNPDGQLPHAEAIKLAENAQKAHFKRLALASRRAKAAKRKAAQATAGDPS